MTLVYDDFPAADAAAEPAFFAFTAGRKYGIDPHQYSQSAELLPGKIGPGLFAAAVTVHIGCPKQDVSRNSMYSAAVTAYVIVPHIVYDRRRRQYRKPSEPYASLKLCVYAAAASGMSGRQIALKNNSVIPAIAYAFPELEMIRHVRPGLFRSSDHSEHAVTVSDHVMVLFLFSSLAVLMTTDRRGRTAGFLPCRFCASLGPFTP